MTPFPFQRRENAPTDRASFCHSSMDPGVVEIKRIDAITSSEKESARSGFRSPEINVRDRFSLLRILNRSMVVYGSLFQLYIE